MNKILFLILISLSVNFYAQNNNHKITQSYNKEKLNNLAKQFKNEFIAEKEKALKLAKLNHWEIKIKTSNQYKELMRVDKDNNPIYYSIYNINAANSTRANTLHNGGTLGLNIEGQNMTAYVWDAGIARITHQEYDGIGGNNRYSVGDSSTELDFHAAHVTGTIIASGVTPNSKGMAPQASVIGFEWNNDLSEVTTQASNGMLISNHSYGLAINNVSDYRFGQYSYKSRQWDEILYNAPYYLMVVAAGNDGLDNVSNGNPLDGNSNYDKLSDKATTKNNLVVANGQDAVIDSNGNLISIAINPSSSQGPTDDYRIKPDITGNGTGLFSSVETSDDAYDTLTGTSMASPNVAGSLLLLQQYYNNINSIYMKAATLKGLALHTADDAGISGPDAIFGWGLLNTKKAANTITDNGTTSIIEEITLHQGQVYQRTVQADGVNDLIASISWTDPADTSYHNTNDNTPCLINDLDFQITQNGNTFQPFKLTSVNTNSTGDNIVDPYEKIIIPNASGSYTITISHKGELADASQNFSLIITGKQNNTVCNAETPTNIQAVEINNNDTYITWNYIENTSFNIKYRQQGNTVWETLSTINNEVLISNLIVDSYYEVQVKSLCSNGNESAFSNIFTFRTASIGYCPGAVDVGFIDDFEDEIPPNIDSCWTIHGEGDNNNYIKSYTYSDTNNTFLNAKDRYTQSVYLVSPFLNDFNSSRRISIKTQRNFTIGTMSDPNNSNTFTPYQDVNVNYGEIKEYHVDFKNYNGNDNYVAFRRKGTNIYFSLDDFSYENSPSCIEPKNLSSNELSATNINLSWLNESNATQWIIEYGEENFTLGTGTQLTVNTNPYTIENLEASTTYDIYIKAICNATDESQWSYKITRETACGILAPYQNDFDSSEEWNYFQNCWSGGYIDSSSIRINDNATTILPELIDFDNSKRIRFWIRKESSYQTGNVIIGTKPETYGTTTPFITIPLEELSTQFKYYIVDFNDYTGTDKFISIYNDSNGSGSSREIHIDNFVYEETPSCLEVTNITTTPISSTEIEISWDEIGNATEWEIEYGLSEYTLGTGTIVSSTNTSKIISGLEHGTRYDFYVRASCSSTDKSNWMPLVTDRTDCGDVTAGYIQDFNYQLSSSSSITDICWNTILPSNGYLNIFQAGRSIENNGRSIKMKVVRSYPTDPSILISPELNDINNNKRIRFWLMRNSTDSDESIIQIGTISDVNDINTFTELETYNILELSNEWKQYTINLDNYSDLANRIAVKLIKGSDNSNTSIIYFDRFEYSEIPTCTTPTNLSLNDYSNYNATLSWEENDNATQWEITYSEGDEFYDNATTVIANTNPFTVNNLINDTNYNFWVRSICDVNNKSDYSEKLIINSSCGQSFNVDYTEDFNTNPNSCWELYEFPSELSYAEASIVQVESGNSAVYLKSNNGDRGGLLVSPLLNNLSTDKKITFSLNIISGYVNVGTMSNPNDYQTFHKLGTVFATTIGEWEEKTFYLQNYNTNDQYIAFQTLKYSYHGYPYSNTTPTCLIDNFYYEQSVNCVEVPEISVDNITEHSIEINWNECENAIEYEYEYKLLNNYSIIETVSSLTTLNSITNLIGNTDYEVRARVLCDDDGDGLYTPWSEYLPFSTSCDERSAPYFDSFEAENTCWLDLNTSNNRIRIVQNVSQTDITAITGEKFVTFSAWSNPLTVLLITPPLLEISNKRIRFNALKRLADPYDTNPSNLQVGTMSDPNDPSTFNLIETVSFDKNNTASYHNTDVFWKEFTVYLDNYTGNDQYIAFRNDDSNSEYSFFIEDFYFEEIPMCTEPLYAQVSNITYESVTINWIDYLNQASSWEIEYGIEGFSLGNGTTISNNQGYFELNNLQDDTYYDYYLKSNCGSEYSSWSTKFSFKTECIGIEVGTLENFDSYPIGGLDNNCWNSLLPNLWGFYNDIIITDVDGSWNYTPHSEPNSMKLFNETNRGDLSNQVILVSPRLIDFNNYKKISFWMRSVPSVYASPSEIIIGTLSDPYDYSTFTSYETITTATQNEGDWIKYEIDFANYYLTDEYIGIRQAYINDRQTILIDDFEYLDKDCNKPTNLFAYQTGANEITFEWQDNNTDTPINWEINYGDDVYSPGNYQRTNVTANTNPFTITGLTEFDLLNFYVKSNCTTETSSSWSDSYEFYVSCTATTPLTENFDSLNAEHTYMYGSENFCWLITNNHAEDVREYIPPNTNNTNSLPNTLLLAYYDYDGSLTPDPGIFISPYLSDLDNTKILQFWASSFASSDTYPIGLIIGTMKNPIDQSTFTPFTTIHHNDLDETGKQFMVDFSTYTGDDKFIAFKHDGVNGYTYINLDDIIYRNHDSCMTPYNIMSHTINSTTATINWDTFDAASSFDVEYGLQGYNQGYGTTQNTTTTNITINSLNSETSYDYYVKTNCENNDESAWEGPFTFTTTSSPIALPWFEGFENLPTLGFNQFPDDFYTNQYMYSTDALYTDESYSMYPGWPFEGSNYIAGNPLNDLWVITPMFNLTAGETYFFDFNFMFKDHLISNTSDEYIEVYGIKGHQTSDEKYFLNQSIGLFNYYNPNYDNLSQSFTPTESGQYSFGVYMDDIGNYAEDLCLDNFSVFSLTGNTILSENSENFQDVNYNNIGITNGTNSLSIINDELLFTSLTNQNWVQTINKTNTTDSWTDNPSYISTLKMDVDATTSPLVTLNFKLKQRYYENVNESQFRVLINDEQFGNIYMPSTHYDSYQDISLDLSAYNGQNYTVKLQFLGKNSDYEITTYGTGDEAYIDDVSILRNNAVSTSEQIFDTLTYYPNPTNGKFYINNLNDEIDRITIYTMLGQEVFNKTYNKNQIIIDLENFENSIYFIDVYINNTKKTLKIVKQ